MLVTVFRRIAELVAVLLLVSFGTFALVSLMPGDPAVVILGEGHTPEEYQAKRVELGLEKPLLVRYGVWLASALRGDFGTSFFPPHYAVSERLQAALPISIELAVLALVLSLVIAIPLALWSAYHAGGRLDRLVSAGSFAVLSVPSFLVGLLLIMVFVNQLGWFPRAEWVRPSEDLGANLYHAALPALAVALAEAATFTRVLRNDLGATLREDFILSARARGMTPIRIMVTEALRPSSFSLITVLGISLGRLIGSTVIVEFLFALPGMGSLIVGAADTGDVAVVQAGVLVIAVIYVAVNALVDLSYGLVDPRTRKAG